MDFGGEGKSILLSPHCTMVLIFWFGKEIIWVLLTDATLEALNSH